MTHQTELITLQPSKPGYSSPAVDTGAAGWPYGDLSAAGTMSPENVAALVGAGVLSVIGFPSVAVSLGDPP